jgi:hypothetical protein
LLAPARRALAVQLATPVRSDRSAALSPALAAAKARGARSRRRCGPPPRPRVTPLPAPPSAGDLCALLDAAARERGARYGVDFRRFCSCRALLAALYSRARARERGRPVSGTVRSSWGYLAKLVGELLAWEADPDHYDNGQRRRSSLRRWLRELEAVGLVRTEIVYDDEGQERGLDIELRPVPPPPTDALERAAGRLARWRARYGDGDELATRRSGAILARLERRRRVLARRFRRRAQGGLNRYGLPLLGAIGDESQESNRPTSRRASCGARARGKQPRYTRSTPTASATANTASSAATLSSQDAGSAAELALRWMRWQTQLRDAEATCLSWPATVDQPLPPLPVLRMALAGRLQGAPTLAAGEPIAGLGPALALRLRRAAARWLRWRPAGAPDPAAELLRRASETPGVELAALVRGFAVDVRRQARHGRATQPGRLDAAHRRAARRRAQLLAAWPGWLKRAGDRLVLDPGNRFLQVHRLPTPAELADSELRRWLRAITALQWYAPAAALELTDPDGRYTYLPLDAAQLANAGERTRGPWTSKVPRRRLALERARRAIDQRARRRYR